MEGTLMGIIKEDMHEKKIKQNDNPVVSGRSGSVETSGEYCTSDSWK